MGNAKRKPKAERRPKRGAPRGRELAIAKIDRALREARTRLLEGLDADAFRSAQVVVNDPDDDAARPVDLWLGEEKCSHEPLLDDRDFAALLDEEPDPQAEAERLAGDVGALLGRFDDDAATIAVMPAQRQLGRVCVTLYVDGALAGHAFAGPRLSGKALADYNDETMRRVAAPGPPPEPATEAETLALLKRTIARAVAAGSLERGAFLTASLGAEPKVVIFGSERGGDDA